LKKQSLPSTNSHVNNLHLFTSTIPNLPETHTNPAALLLQCFKTAIKKKNPNPPTNTRQQRSSLRHIACKS